MLDQPPLANLAARWLWCSAGAWNIKNAVELRWTAGDQWVASVPLPAGGVYEYKYVLIDYETKQALEWQSGSNAVLAVVVSETDLDVYDNWCVQSALQPPFTAQSPPLLRGSAIASSRHVRHS